MLTRVMIRMEDAGFLKRQLFHYFIGVARRYGEAILNQPAGAAARPAALCARQCAGLWAAEERARPVARARRLYRGRGDRARSVLVLPLARHEPEAALRPDRGVPLSSPRSRTAQIYSDTVGPALPNVDIRIADNGEVQFKSPGMFVSYFKDDAKTKETMTPDGYVKTGDAGFFDAKTGHLKIIDRAKDVGKLKDGTLFPPKYIENKLKFYPNIREAVAYGDGRDFVAVMINIDLTAVGSWAERNNVVYGSYQELAGHPLVYDMIAEATSRRSTARSPRTR